ncbi:cache domain-containing protein [Pseudorhodoferax sp. Leaf267]|uniref:cache domain-containing protein n=1 Tax=Pseudorhodoferax sp. Leaf267 TaxID=1736316 RepID=UPI0006F74564|nr:cache domain-containing protein [Pseudorhodoferax sp. Leaf267]KQP21511.1 histidine kinase [Pseudorhodoferax sp. Leaf267]
MQLRLKLVLLSAVPIVVALALMGATMQQQTLTLAREERALVQAAFVHSKEAELQHYVELARNTLMRIAEAPGPVGARKEEALATLMRMQYGSNGYFFAYDQHGKLLMDPKSLPMQGVDFCDPDDPVGADSAQRILATARRGGGVVRYSWNKPSSQAVVPKLGYVLMIPGWDWVIGTGIYLDDVQGALQAIEAGARANIEATRKRLYGIAALCVVLIGLGGLALNLKDHRVSSDKLRRLARRVVHSQEEERVRVARELHDGVVQVLASSKFLLETAQLQLADPAAASAAAPRQALDQGIARLGGALLEIRRVSHGLRPALLDDLGLAPALALLVEQMNEQGGCDIHLLCEHPPAALPLEHGTALFRIAQEALHNVRTHADATQVDVVLRGARARVELLVIDNGGGFDTQRVFADGKRGIGLRNMRERAAGLGGTLAIVSGREGTRIHASLPLPAGDTEPLAGTARAPRAQHAAHPLNLRPTEPTP